ncbi:Holliday junction resolvase RuvX [Labilibaculum sp. A4]|uniref:Putative pre-16S rRNA nuclease n=1 Tax=Labilibaculum euxinus TaxID=2686357 RepID=A0A425YHC3_9BACT|nr:Holliday junction resolvase RuvX [Labilibaculum euxinus]MDQ1769552.1 Holliday junction resolvase RuvX [Labilibaculum euxinus]MUP36302.1 Holliday junction resolvase RuvX [Labilibaculum euxinus]MVB05507.1 Holliday junction resolvase RuvX [Labilibaculum euxinus]MWN75077.1 Holliday junction resolvase RuvX [Labilibaculum euxinus]
MARIVAIDYGRKRVGLAVTDPFQIIANGLDTVAAKDVLTYLEKYFQTEEVECIVVGYPKQMNNEDSESVKYLKPFLGQLKKKFPEIPIELVDERFTSKIAFQTMIDGGLGKKARRDKAMIDKVSAAIILQSYMETKRNLF